MKNPIKFHLLRFLQKHLDPKRPVLLGLSGGNDSTALFYLLLEVQNEQSQLKSGTAFKFGIAHIDHGWRKESSFQASQLKNLSAEHGIPFHLKSLDHDPKLKNLEAKCREERLFFFKELCNEWSYQAVILAHHLDDQAETVLKNIFEGAALCYCNGIAERMKINDLEIWRPLLSFQKKQLSASIQTKQFQPFIDETNEDCKFLRARMRKEILPHLEGLFGKGIKQSLASHGNEAQELKNFIETHLEKILNNCRSSEIGTLIDLTPYHPLTLFEIKCLIRQVCEKENCLPSKKIIHSAATQLLSRSSNKEYIMGKHHLYVDRLRLFVSSDKVLNSKETSCTKKISMIINNIT